MGDWKEGLKRAKQWLGNAPALKAVAATGRASAAKHLPSQAATPRASQSPSEGAPIKPLPERQAEQEATGSLNLPRSTVLTRQGEFRDPPSGWIGKGRLTQLRDGLAGRGVEVFIGVDF